MNRNEIIKIIQDFKNEYADKYGILKIGIFGSVARGDNTDDSDIDIFITMKITNLVLLSRIRQELEEKINTRVDLIQYRDKMNQFLKARIDKEGIYV
ncbi:MAG TPA: nucleotidyltransferase domain-containing protein [Leptospiraceae bacterium]|nr:nucleotidyltransferase domain-containing protein [Leptospiraceae bacterium]HMW07196.1 nucleotidyltransferase domain-containing protein [Leptospiraceae bacterium]HMX33789.1 nucleotidyltransferase domain-containing protein [Leptospiraceae bacterium]HMY32812.1 nucleotidyltransferase domain-containing protein [Leptospiraceae bacterium]HMZ67092.1 nucleotidyltransferase domain-containing protein [Leptospiraceae bacterium]